MGKDRRAGKRLGRIIRDMDGELRERVLSVMATPPEGRSRAIGKLYADPRTRTIADVLIDIEANSFAGSLTLDAPDSPRRHRE